MFDDATSKFKKKKITVTLGGTVKEVFIVSALLYMKGNHKCHQISTCHSEINGSAICITFNWAAAWEAYNETEVIGEQINATTTHQQNLDHISIME